MASFNRVILVGNLTRDPDMKYTASGTAVANIGLAVNRTWMDKATSSKQEEVSFIDVTLWGKQAELASQYLSKGRALLVEGRLKQDRWEDKESGQARSKLTVVCEKMEFLGGSGGGARRGEESQDPQGDSLGAPGLNDDVPF